MMRVSSSELTSLLTFLVEEALKSAIAHDFVAIRPAVVQPLWPHRQQVKLVAAPQPRIRCLVKPGSPAAAAAHLWKRPEAPPGYPQHAERSKAAIKTDKIYDARLAVQDLAPNEPSSAYRRTYVRIWLSCACTLTWSVAYLPGLRDKDDQRTQSRPADGRSVH
jgi:hypothetical protein